MYFAGMSVSAAEDLVVQSAELLPTIRGLITSLNEIVGVSQAVKVDIQEATDNARRYIAGTYQNPTQQSL